MPTLWHGDGLRRRRSAFGATYQLGLELRTATRPASQARPSVQKADVRWSNPRLFASYYHSVRS